MKLLTEKLTEKTLPPDLFAFYSQGDCLENVPELLDDELVDLVVTDPPYGIGGDNLHKHYNRNESLVIDGYTEIPSEQYEDFSKQWITEAERVLRPGGSMYLVSGWTHLRDILNALAQTRLKLVNHIIWKYNFGVFTRMKFVTSHYHILYLVKPGKKPTFNTYSRFAATARTQNNRSELYADMEDVWIIDREYKTGRIRHKNELPTSLLAKMIQYSSREGDLVADFFAGSFSTAKVAKGLNRSSISFEISEEACRHQVPIVEKVAWGELLDRVPRGKDDRPANQLKPWSEKDLDDLAVRYRRHRAHGLNKKQAIEHLQADFQRGYFSVLNALKKRGL